MDLGPGPRISLRAFRHAEGASGVGFGYSSGIFISAWMPLYSIPLFDLFKPIEDGNIWMIDAFWPILAGVVRHSGGPGT
jgi:hypothetical protein